MKKYNIIYKNPLVHDSEIEKYMDFKSALLGKEKFILNASIHSYLKIGLLSLSVVTVVLTTYYLNNSSGSVPIQQTPPIVKEKPHPKSEARKVPDPISNPIIQTREETPDKNPSLDKDANTREPAQKITKSPAIVESFIEASPQAGYTSLYEYFSLNLKFPEKAKEDSVTGTVLVEFVVSEKGKIEKIKVIKGLSTELDIEAKRLISEMPDWKPASINGKCVSTKLTLPLSFSLEEN